jgi:hypothetical protein
MKPKFYFFLATVCLFLSSCMLRPAQPVTTKEETINDLMGTWKPKDKAVSPIKSLDFQPQDVHGVYRVLVKVARDSTNVETYNGTWDYTDVGKVTINYSLNLSSVIELKNSRVMVMDYTEILTK